MGKDVLKMKRITITIDTTGEAFGEDLEGYCIRSLWDIEIYHILF